MTDSHPKKKKNRITRPIIKDNDETTKRAPSHAIESCIVCKRSGIILTHCPTCKANYCGAHLTSDDWKSVAAGIDYQYRYVKCPKGHEWRDESYA
ncbi:hypothetical protein J4219_01205 [Candidatus Woesearchaeota archaeon]|nr:hypothetical protein [Candidatus Woesearchaeota archaeon]